MGVSKNRGTPKSSILIGFSIINHPFGGTPIFGNTHISNYFLLRWRATKKLSNNDGKTSPTRLSWMYCWSGPLPTLRRCFDGVKVTRMLS